MAIDDTLDANRLRWVIGMATKLEDVWPDDSPGTISVVSVTDTQLIVTVVYLPCTMRKPTLPRRSQ